MAEPNIARILDYLNANAAQYGLEALRTQLLAAGYARDDVDAAIARFQQAQSDQSAVPATTQLPVDPAATERLGDSDPAHSDSAPNIADVPLADDQPPAPQGDDRQAAIARARAYIEANRDRYELDALRGTLVQTGYSDDVIAAALAQIGPIKKPRVKRDGGDAPIWPLALLVMVGNYIVISMVLTLEVVVATNGIIFGIGMLLLFGAEIGAWLLLRGGPRDRFGRILGLGALFTLLFTFGSVALLALIIGACLALIGAF